MSKFPWGKVVDYLQIDLDGDKLEVVKYYGNVGGGAIKTYNGIPSYHIEVLHASYNTVQSALIAYMAYKSLGLNQHTLVSGICRALEIKE